MMQRWSICPLFFLVLGHGLHTEAASLTESAHKQPPILLLDTTNSHCLVNVGGSSYNLTSVFPSPFFNATLSIDPHAPSFDTVSLIGSPCSVMAVDPAVPAEDQCQSNTRFCRIVTNWKHGVGRVVTVQSYVAGDSPLTAATVIPDGVSISYLGLGDTQVLLNIHCKKDTTNPTQPSVILESKKITLTWEHSGGCVSSMGSGAEPGSSSMSTAGLFFTMFFAGLCGYFVVGMAYNFAVLKIAHFPEILPHHELWITLVGHIMVCTAEIVVDLF
ncbi:hypothetical protein BASA50_004184 [Batrachochytrium salamandrivorans]|uniref:Autophagy-related protein 27 n=1 Tax=Batrachochytrium salamandrivorans TaxID=1357716 RepID=A0ABQ8FGA5_9FUNG|nr:hypothetical protein BASA60_008658 [Batrachochytrium salamandrivorans]KAH6596750.1 hypothetical protein BASA61_003361 [Batrachochytrium salamandrivorans]KAH6597839.1 hypothetical protein BASA50_004184 [Batrachochytrium salamandrivorans]KAJ1330291.1 hypothetical protein BSLG_009427 [Batrachochytrium salamandrivorans]KAJ1344420.1 hypothetical protein BSLG_000980 [Batrachochytrium salamandrivorans]